MKTFFFLVILASLLLSSCTNKKHDQLIVAKVGSHILTSKEFADLLIKKIHNFSSLELKSEKDLSQIKTRIVDDFILDSISVNWAKENGVAITTKEVEAKTQKIRSSYPDEVYFRKALIDEKITYRTWVKNIRRSLLTKKISQSLFKSSRKYSTKELKDFYSKNKSLFKKKAQVKLQQILVEKQIDAEQLLKKLYRKHNFSNLAKVHSISPEATSGGHLGWLTRGINKVFDRGFSMGVGRTSPVLKSPYGFHIIKVLAKKSAKNPSFASVKGAIKKILIENSKEKIYKQWLSKQVKKSAVYKNTQLISNISVSMRGKR